MDLRTKIGLIIGLFLIFAPLALIWSLNTLFHCNIAYDTFEYLAAAIIMLFLL